jgi:hypothetical protein
MNDNQNLGSEKISWIYLTLTNTSFKIVLLYCIIILLNVVTCSDIVAISAWRRVTKNYTEYWLPVLEPLDKKLLDRPNEVIIFRHSYWQNFLNFWNTSHKTEKLMFTSSWKFILSVRTIQGVTLLHLGSCTYMQMHIYIYIYIYLFSFH